ncbi:DUF488 domain-containing protein [Mesorhizobium sp. B2-4-1]|nr:DUF488 domain-containing protein [Mesorhizobium sp. B2-4-8]TPL65311.1 DUF488 domain-containing protein [Mesorhizobium sp. B2-4-1]
MKVSVKVRLSVGRQQRCAIMCSETLWWRCHRRIVANYLISRGESAPPRHRRRARSGV